MDSTNTSNADDILKMAALICVLVFTTVIIVMTVLHVVMWSRERGAPRGQNMDAENASAPRRSPRLRLFSRREPNPESDEIPLADIPTNPGACATRT